MSRWMVLLALLAVAAPRAYALPECYHTLDEIDQFLTDLQADHPDYIHIDSVGHSQRENLPIYLVRVSDNAAVRQDRPATLLIGQIHAEEVLGIEVTLRAIEELVTNPAPRFRQWRNNLEMYFIPTMNPEGLRVVHGEGDDLVHGADSTYRKNKRDNIGDGIFRYQLGRGGDTSGVDLNRNFDINFFHGDTLFHHLDETEVFDYYRGPGPFSEPETRAIRAVFHEINPLFSVTYHSSRSGNFSEKAYYPWDWGNDGERLAPDQAVLDDIAQGFAEQIPRLSGQGNYEFLRSAGRNGKMHDWAYAEGGWVNLQAEIGSTNIFPPADVMNQVVEDNLNGVYYLFDRAMASPDLETASGDLKITVTDPDGLPLVAEVFLPDYHDGYLKPRMTDPLFGVHRRPLMPGNHTVITRAYGYLPDTSVVNIGDHFETPVAVTLQPLTRHNVTVLVRDGDQPLPAVIVVHRALGVDTLEVPGGTLHASWPEGEFTLEVWAEGYIPKVLTFDLGEAREVWAFMVAPESVQDEDFEAPLSGAWTQDGEIPWGRSGLYVHEGTYALNSAPDEFLPPDAEGSIQVEYDIPAGSESLVLTGWYAFELEPDEDFGTVEVRFDQGSWMVLDTLNGFAGWHRFIYDLHEGAAGASTVAFRWSVSTDPTDGDRGLFLDDLALLAASQYLSTPGEEAAVPLRWALRSAYPNPFNPVTTLRFEVPVRARVRIALFDILGRRVLTALDRDIAPGEHRLALRLDTLPSGMYFVKMSAPEFHAVRKIVLLK